MQRNQILKKLGWIFYFIFFSKLKTYKIWKHWSIFQIWMIILNFIKTTLLLLFLIMIILLVNDPSGVNLCWEFRNHIHCVFIFIFFERRIFLIHRENPKRVRVNHRIMVTKSHFTPSRSTELESHHQIQFSTIPRTLLWMWDFTLSKEYHQQISSPTNWVE